MPPRSPSISPTDLLTSLIHALSAPTTDATSTTTTTPPAEIPPTAKRLLATLHTLLPHTLLDALDLLDRGCVVRAVLAPDSSARAQSSAAEARRETAAREARREYFVRSTSGSRWYHVHTTAWNCECAVFVTAAFGGFSGGVRDAGEGDGEAGGWRYVERSAGRAREEELGRGEDFMFGGLARRIVKKCNAEEAGLVHRLQATGLLERQSEDEEERADIELAPPICKHLLAAVLAQECGWLFGPREEDNGEGEGATSETEIGRKGVREIPMTREELAGWVAGGGPMKDTGFD